MFRIQPVVIQTAAPLKSEDKFIVRCLGHFQIISMFHHSWNYILEEFLIGYKPDFLLRYVKAHLIPSLYLTYSHKTKNT